jgi:hypothetical protein
MKRVLFSAIILAIAIVAGGCRTKVTLPEKNIMGKAYDVVVLCQDDIWRGDLSYAVCDLLEERAPGLTRPEGYFNIVKQVEPAKATELDRKYSNVLAISINPTVAEATYSVAKNSYARPQTLITVTAPSVESAIAFINDATATLRAEFEKGERTTSNTYNAARPADKLMADFKEHTGLEMVIPAYFYKATTRDSELLWYIRDFPKRADYIFSFTIPVDTTLPEDMRAFSVMSAIDTKLATISSKGAEHSYMRLSNEPSSMTFTPNVKIAGREWMEIRCWWEVANDFMGGPMVSFVNVDETTNVATVIMFAIYAPEDPQRNLLRELEHLMYTIN